MLLFLWQKDSSFAGYNVLLLLASVKLLSNPTMNNSHFQNNPFPKTKWWKGFVQITVQIKTFLFWATPFLVAKKLMLLGVEGILGGVGWQRWTLGTARRTTPKNTPHQGKYFCQKSWSKWGGQSLWGIKYEKKLKIKKIRAQWKGIWGEECLKTSGALPKWEKSGNTGKGRTSVGFSDTC